MAITISAPPSPISAPGGWAGRGPRPVMMIPLGDVNNNKYAGTTKCAVPDPLEPVPFWLKETRTSHFAFFFFLGPHLQHSLSWKTHFGKMKGTFGGLVAAVAVSTGLGADVSLELASARIAQ